MCLAGLDFKHVMPAHYFPVGFKNIHYKGMQCKIQLPEFGEKGGGEKYTVAKQLKLQIQISCGTARAGGGL